MRIEQRTNHRGSEKNIELRTSLAIAKELTITQLTF